MLKKNVGPVDSAIRLIVGLVALTAGVFALGALQGNIPGLVALVIAFIGLASGATRRCPTYVLLGVQTLNDRVEKTGTQKAHA